MSLINDLTNSGWPYKLARSAASIHVPLTKDSDNRPKTETTYADQRWDSDTQSEDTVSKEYDPFEDDEDTTVDGGPCYCGPDAHTRESGG